MGQYDKILSLIEACDEPEKLRTWMKNARGKNEPAIAEAAFRRLIAILPKEQSGTIQHDFWQTVHAFEQVLSDEREKTTRLARTRQKVARVGEIQTLKDWALSEKSTDGFAMLLERNMPELTGEAIVLRHPQHFAPEVVAAARERLERAGVDLTLLVTTKP